MGLSVENLTQAYVSANGDSTVALDDLSLQISEGEFVTIIGQSGCGKSTLLHCLGGLLTPTSGTITVDGRRVTGPDPKLAAFVFQDYSLLPWKSVIDNTAVGLRFAGQPKREARAKAHEMLELVGLADFGRSYPRELSGGMQQRVAVARAMCMDPKILLMDEPFSALDEQTRRHLGFEMAAMLSEKRSTVVLVTHSLEEAILWADRVVVLSSRPGRVIREIQIDEPRPRTLACMREPWFDQVRGELFTLLEPTVRGAAATSDKVG